MGATLLSTTERGYFKQIRKNIEKYMNNAFDLSVLIEVVDDVAETKRLGHRRSMAILSHVITYLRIKLLSPVTTVVEMAAVMADMLVKNGQYRIHILVGRKLFMKTMGEVTRRLLRNELEVNRQVGFRLLDILQGWGEAFIKGERRQIYPHIISTYKKMRSKYGVKYVRIEFDPSRVPIFLGPISKHEKNIPRRCSPHSSTRDVEEVCWETDSITPDLDDADVVALDSASTSMLEADDQTWEIESRASTLDISDEIPASSQNDIRSLAEDFSKLRRTYAARAAEYKRNNGQCQYSSDVNSPARWICVESGWQLIAEPSGHGDVKEGRIAADANLRKRASTSTPANCGRDSRLLFPIYDTESKVDDDLSKDLSTAKITEQYHPVLHALSLIIPTSTISIASSTAKNCTANSIEDVESISSPYIPSMYDPIFEVPYGRSENVSSPYITKTFIEEEYKLADDDDNYALDFATIYAASTTSSIATCSKATISMKKDSHVSCMSPKSRTCSYNGAQINNMQAIEAVTPISFSANSPFYRNAHYSTIAMSPTFDRGKHKYMDPSCDPTLSVKYFGHQRVLVKK